MTAAPLVADGLVYPDLDPDTLAAVHRHVGPFLRCGAPQWGSPAWADLVPDDTARIAAAELAAFRWWAAVVFGGGVPGEVLRAQVARVLKETALDVRAAADWPRLIRQSVQQDAVRRRRLAAVPPQGGAPRG